MLLMSEGSKSAARRVPGAKDPQCHSFERPYCVDTEASLVGHIVPHLTLLSWLEVAR